MSKPTLDDVIYAVYILSMNLSGWCPYCHSSFSGDTPEQKAKHFAEAHEDGK